MAPYKPIFAPSPNRPNLFSRGEAIVIIRDQFEASTLLLVGASLVGAAFLLTKSQYVFVPVYAALALRMLKTASVLLGWRNNELLEGVLPGKFAAQLPPIEGKEDLPAASGIVVFLLGFRNNHPLGLLAPGYKEIGEWATKCSDAAQEKYDEYGLLGMSTFLGTDRSTANQFLNLMYFKNTDGLHKFALGPVHRATWAWWLAIHKTHPHLGIMHEVYDVPAQHWETVYVHMHRAGLAGASEGVGSGGNLKQMWWSTPVDASKGKMRSSRGRMDRSEGDENEKAGLEY